MPNIRTRTCQNWPSTPSSWDETFNDHEFTSRQQVLLQYFNIRYECNDARDDYSTQLKKGDVLDGAFPQWMSSEALNDLNDMDPYDQGADFGDNDSDDEVHGSAKYSGLGKYGRQKQEEMDATKIGIKEAGWLNVRFWLSSNLQTSAHLVISLTHQGQYY